MKGSKHFSHPHNLEFHENLEGAQLSCNGCNFSCTGTPAYSCHACKYFLHEQCFNASRSLAHPLHPDHPLTLLPISTHTSGSFQCDLCHQVGSGYGFSCAACEFDLHVHCAYSELKPKMPTTPLPNQIKIKSHPSHELHYHPKPPYNSDMTCSCDVCGTVCDANTQVYNCNICKYDVHVACANLPEIVKRKDHEHELALLHTNPYHTATCSVCTDVIAKGNSMYVCMPCDYGIHIKCLTAKVSEKAPMNALSEMLELQHHTKMFQMAMDTVQYGNLGYVPPPKGYYHNGFSNPFWTGPINY